MWVRGKWVKVEVNKTCLWCKTEFTATDARKNYCSSTCKNNYNSARYANNHRGELEFYLKRLLAKKDRRKISLEDLKSLLEKQKGRCALSNVDMTWTQTGGKFATNISIDRIIPGGDYTIENIQLVCSAVNTMKSDLTMPDLLDWCKKIISQHETQ